MNREEWLGQVVTHLRPVFENEGHTIPKVRISVGWPRNARKALAECWNTVAASDQVSQIHVAPTLIDPIEIIPIVAHECGHAVINDPSVGHKKPFISVVKSVGLVGPKWTSTQASDEFKALAKKIADDIGPFPHAALSPSEGASKKQTTRMLLVQCEDESCGFKYRTTQKWIDQFNGNFDCPCGEKMEVA